MRVLQDKHNFVISEPKCIMNSAHVSSNRRLHPPINVESWCEVSLGGVPSSPLVLRVSVVTSRRVPKDPAFTQV